MSGIIHTQSQAVGRSHAARLRMAVVVAALVAACALAAVVALAPSDDVAPAVDPAPPAAVQSTADVQPGIRYDGGPEEGSWRAFPANPGRPDGGPEEGTRGPGH